MVPLKGAIERHVSDPGFLPELEFLPPSRLVTRAGGHPDLDAEAGRVAARLLGIAAQLGELRLGRAVRRVSQHHPAVAPFCDAPQRLIMMAAKPDRHATLRGPRVDAGIFDMMPVPLDRHMRLGPKRLHALNLRLRSASPIVEVLVQPNEFDLVPADPDAKPKPAA